MTTTSTDGAIQRHDAAATPREPVVSALARAMARLASWRVWIVSAFLFGPFAGVFFGSSAPFAIPTVEAACGQAPPDVRFSSSAADVNGFLDSCGVVGREAYRSLQVADLFYPMVFAVFMASSLALAISRLAPGRRRLLALAAVPLVASAFDYVENACAWLALAAFPDAAATSSVLGLASAGKSLTSWAAGILFLGALAALAVATFRRRVRPRPRDDVTDDSSQVR